MPGVRERTFAGRGRNIRAETVGDVFWTGNQLPGCDITVTFEGEVATLKFEGRIGRARRFYAAVIEGPEVDDDVIHTAAILAKDVLLPYIRGM